MSYKYLIGESVQVRIIDSLIPAVVTGKTVFEGDNLYELTFKSNKTTVRFEPAILPDTLTFIREETPVQVEQKAVA